MTVIRLLGTVIMTIGFGVTIIGAAPGCVLSHIGEWLESLGIDPKEKWRCS